MYDSTIDDNLGQPGCGDWIVLPVIPSHVVNSSLILSNRKDIDRNVVVERMLNGLLFSELSSRTALVAPFANGGVVGCIPRIDAQVLSGGMTHGSSSHIFSW